MARKANKIPTRPHYGVIRLMAMGDVYTIIEETKPGSGCGLAFGFYTRSDAYAVADRLNKAND